MVSTIAKADVVDSRYGAVAGIASAGVVIGSISVIFSLSFAAIIYDGPLAPYLGQGIGLTLIGAVIMGIVGALTMSYRGTICQPQDVTAILLAVTAATLVNSSGLDPQAAFATVAVLVGLSTVATGMAAYAMGALRLGYVVRFVPLPVISGFLAASGALLVRGGFEMVVPQVHAGSGTLLADLLQTWPHWLPWLAVAAVLSVLVRTISSGLTVPIVLLAATLGFYAALPLLSLDLAAARALGLLLGPFGSQTFVGDLDLDVFLRADWPVILSQFPMILAIIGMSTLGTLLNASGLELAIRREVDLDRDLRGVGLANMAAGLGGGMVGYHLLGETLLARRIGIGGVAAGFSVSVVCALGLFLGAGALSNLPIGLLALVIWYLGVDLLVTAIYDHGWRLPWGEFAVVIVTPAIALGFGFLPAVGFGVLLACLLFIASYASVDVVRMSTTGATLRARIERSPEEFRSLGELGGCVHIYKLSGFLFFGSAHRLVERIRQGAHGRAPHRIVIVDLDRVPGLDISALAAFERLARRFKEQDVRFILTGLSPHMRKLFKSWASSHDSHIEIAASLDDAMETIEEDLLGGQIASHAADGVGHGHARADDAVEKALETYGERIELAAGDMVMREGSEADHLIVLITGRLKVMVTNSKGVALTVNRLRPGAILGEVGFYANVPRTANVVAETAATAMRITNEALSRMESESPSQAAAFHRNLAGMLARRLMNSTQLLKEAEV